LLRKERIEKDADVRVLRKRRAKTEGEKNKHKTGGNDALTHRVSPFAIDVAWYLLMNRMMLTLDECVVG
jgi:hypothetical protein